MNEKKQFKTKVIKWLNENGLYPKVVKVYNTRRYGIEVRVYGRPITYFSERNSSRMVRGTKIRTETGYTWERTYGKHEITIPNYIHINEHDFSTEAEREIILDMVKHEAIL